MANGEIYIYQQHRTYMLYTIYIYIFWLYFFGSIWTSTKFPQFQKSSLNWIWIIWAWRLHIEARGGICPPSPGFLFVKVAPPPPAKPGGAITAHPPENAIGGQMGQVKLPKNRQIWIFYYISISRWTRKYIFFAIITKFYEFTCVKNSESP